MRNLTACVLALAVAGVLAGDARAQGTVETDRAGLIALYHATNGPSWTDSTNWLSDEPLADWFGVATDVGGRVTALSLPGNALSGPISTALVSLALLERLDLGSRWDPGLRRPVYNALVGPIPRQLSRFANLRRLDLDSNRLTGPIPTELAGLAKLELLSLSSNRLTGSIPTELANLASLRWLYLFNNQLSGPIPTALARLASLQSLNLGANQLSGPIPTELAQLANLQLLNLGANQLSGPIPPELGRLTNLRGLELRFNELSGPIPAELGQLASLQSLNLWNNQLSGPIPTALARLANLQQLDLDDNQLSGPIPAELGQLASLQFLFLRGNQLSGPIPPELAQSVGLQVLSLGNNHLSGPIPPVLAQLERLQALFLWGNQLSGPIPTELANLANLVVLDLQSNQLSGPIPEELANLARLRGMSVSFNEQLTGTFPLRLQSLPLASVSLLGTAVCVSDDAEFRAWSTTIDFRSSGRTCGAPVPEVSVIDVAVFYTPAARRAHGGTVAIRAEIDLWIAETNRAYVESGVQQLLVLAARQEVLYTEDQDEFGSLTDLIRLANPSDGHLDHLNTIRDRVGADLVHLISGRENPDVCGIAYIAGDYGLTHRLCGADTFAHELGHNMGLNHDRYVTCTPQCPNWPYPYGHGYVNQRATAPGASESASWATIMAYSQQCFDMNLPCSRLLRFSNPRQAWQGDPLGVPGSQQSPFLSGPADAARALNGMRHSMAALRHRPGRPGDWAEQLEWYRGSWKVFTDGGAPDGGAAATGASAAATAFTDHPVETGTTPVKAIHFREIRGRIADLRAGAGLPPVQWTDSTLTPGVTPVRRIHLTELRAALDAVYDAEGRSRPSYTDAAVTAGATAIRAVHLVELRAAIAALD